MGGALLFQKGLSGNSITGTAHHAHRSPWRRPLALGPAGWDEGETSRDMDGVAEHVGGGTPARRSQACSRTHVATCADAPGTETPLLPPFSIHQRQFAAITAIAIFPERTDLQAGKTAASSVGSSSRIDNLLRLGNDCFFGHLLKDGRYAAALRHVGYI
jgi:hypothetical protein